MFKKNNKSRPFSSSSSDIARLDFHDYFGRLQDRTKASTNQKPLGVMMIDKVVNRFGLSEEDIKRLREELKEKEKRDFAELQNWAESRPFQPKYSPFPIKSKPKSIFETGEREDIDAEK